MFWCQNNKQQLLGMVRIDTAVVIRSCKRQLERIYKERSEMKRAFISNYLNSYWAKIRRFFWISVTKRDALFAYYYGAKIPESMWTKIAYRKQEIDLKKILEAAEAITGKTMYLSTEGIRVCNL